LHQQEQAADLVFTHEDDVEVNYDDQTTLQDDDEYNFGTAVDAFFSNPLGPEWND
jgi:hypothetical protein